MDYIHFHMQLTTLQLKLFKEKLLFANDAKKCESINQQLEQLNELRVQADQQANGIRKQLKVNAFPGGTHVIPVPLNRPTNQNKRARLNKEQVLNGSSNDCGYYSTNNEDDDEGIESNKDVDSDNEDNNDEGIESNKEDDEKSTQG
jgi:hypothetical protein